MTKNKLYIDSVNCPYNVQSIKRLKKRGHTLARIFAAGLLLLVGWALFSTLISTEVTFFAITMALIGTFFITFWTLVGVYLLGRFLAFMVGGELAEAKRDAYLQGLSDGRKVPTSPSDGDDYEV